MRAELGITVQIHRIVQNFHTLNPDVQGRLQTISIHVVMVRMLYIVKDIPLSLYLSCIKQS